MLFIIFGWSTYRHKTNKENCYTGGSSVWVGQFYFSNQVLGPNLTFSGWIVLARKDYETSLKTFLIRSIPNLLNYKKTHSWCKQDMSWSTNVIKYLEKTFSHFSALKTIDLIPIRILDASNIRRNILVKNQTL